MMTLIFNVGLAFLYAFLGTLMLTIVIGPQVGMPIDQRFKTRKSIIMWWVTFAVNLVFFLYIVLTKQTSF